jgi:hypothetical protein
MQPSRTQELHITQREAHRIRVEHRELLSQLRELARYVDTPSGPMAPWLAALVGRLDHLTSLLAAHFAMEERSELFGDFLTSFPRFQHRMDELKAEHNQILEHAERLRADCLREDLDLTHEQIARYAHTLINLLRRHEREEGEIMQAAYTVDIGSMD